MSRPAFLPSSSVVVCVHVFESSTFATVIHAGEGRATVRLDGSGGDVTVFADRAELVRLRDVFADVVTELDAARARLAAELTGELTGQMESAGAVAV